MPSLGLLPNNPWLPNHIGWTLRVVRYLVLLVFSGDGLGSVTAFFVLAIGIWNTVGAVVFSVLHNELKVNKGYEEPLYYWAFRKWLNIEKPDRPPVNVVAYFIGVLTTAKHTAWLVALIAIPEYLLYDSPSMIPWWWAFISIPTFTMWAYMANDRLLPLRWMLEAELKWCLNRYDARVEFDRQLAGVRWMLLPECADKLGYSITTVLYIYWKLANMLYGKR